MHDHEYLYDEDDILSSFGPDWSELEWDEDEDDFEGVDSPEDDEEYLEWLKNTGADN